MTSITVSINIALGAATDKKRLATVASCVLLRTVAYTYSYYTYMEKVIVIYTH